MDSGCQVLPVEAIPIPIVCYDPDTLSIRSVNTPFADLVQVPSTQLTGNRLESILFAASSCSNTPSSSLASSKNPLPSRDQFLQDQDSSSLSSNVFNSQVIECHSPGGVSFFASFSVNFQDPKVVVLAVKHIAQEKAEEKQGETDEEKDFMKRLEDFPAMLYTYVKHPDGSHKYTYASAGSRRLWNMSPDEVMAPDGADRLFAAVVNPERLANSIQESATSLKTWNWTGQFRVRDKNDPSKTKRRWLRAISQPKKLPDGSVQWDGSVFDITKEKEQRIQIENAQRSIAKEQERVKFAQEFSELLSHEVRNPLASIDSCALLTSNSIDGLIKRTSLRDSCHHDSNETQGNGYLQEGLVAIKEDIGQIMNCTDYIKCVVENTLDLVKLRLHRLELNYTVVDLERDVLEPTTQMFRRTHQAVEIYTVCESKIKIRCDAFRLRQILVNLVNNGIKHTPNGYIRIVALRNSPQMVTIAVEDTGTGIPPEQHGKVFIKYEKAKKDKSGHGIGLSLCRELVDKMGGDIRVDPSYSSSTHGIGTRIEISLPYEEEELELATYESKENQNVELTPDVRALICDDSEMSQTLMKRRLAAISSGWAFDLCRTGEAAVEAAKWKRYGLIVIDENLDDGGGKLRGHETMRKLRDELGCTTPIIGCSASELSTVHLDSGADLVWRKPLPNDSVMVADLLRVLSKAPTADSTPIEDRKRRKLG